MKKLRDLLMKRLGWDGEQATAVAEPLTKAIATFIRVFKDTDTAGQDVALTYTLTPTDMPGVRHVVVTVSMEKVLCHLRFDSGNDLMVDFTGLSAYNPANARTTIRVPKKVVKAGKALRHG